VYRLRSWLSEVWRLGAALRRRNNLPIDLFMLMNAHFLERALFVAAELGIADLLRDGPKALSELSTLTNTDASMLGRILRALESFGLFAEDEADRFRLTEAGERLRSDHPSSYRHWIRYLGGMWFQAASAMPESVRTGRNGWDLAFGMPAWEHLAQFPAVRKIFDRGMSVWTALHTPEILKAYDFSRFRELVDVGGNKGTLLTSILAAHRGLRGCGLRS
jgi:predicted transcriptional regulator